MYEMLKEFIKPELLVLIPVLYLCGNGFKKSQIPNKNIPMLLGGISISLSLLFIVATTTIIGWQEMLMALFSGLTQGVLCAGASVYFNEVIKQINKE